MADEITGYGVLGRYDREDGTMFYYWELSTPILDGDGFPVVPVTDTARIPDYLDGRIPQVQLDAIAAGDAIYEITTMEKAGETDAAFLVRARADRLLRMPAKEQEYRDMAVEFGVFDRRRFQTNG